jgi:hypothetical protein
MILREQKGLGDQPRTLPQGYRRSHDPNAIDYGQFVQAVVKRYNGSFLAPDAAGQSTAQGRPAAQGAGLGRWATSGTRFLSSRSATGNVVVS